MAAGGGTSRNIAAREADRARKCRRAAALAEALADLGDMVVAAYRDAKARADAMATEALGPLAGGLPGGEPGDLPGGLGLPGQLGF